MIRELTLLKGLTFGCLLLVVAVFVAIGCDLAIRGLPGLSWSFLVDDVEEAGRSGGIGPIFVSTFLIVVLSVLISLPLSLASAILCSELLGNYPRLSRLARRSFDMMVSVPSVAVGLVGWTFFGVGLGLKFSILGGSMTLALMLLPVMTAAFVAGLDAVPLETRAESLALGTSRWQTLCYVVLPAARPALFAGIALAVGRATAETAVLMLTAGVSARMAESIFDPGATLAVHVYALARNVPQGEAQAYTTALALFIISTLVYAVLSTFRQRAS